MEGELTNEQKEKIFRVELERFRMHERLERTIFYWWLVTLASIIYLSSQGVNILNIGSIGWWLILSLFLMVGEFLINILLNKEKEDLIRKIKQDLW